ncbi:MAG: MarR family transcriptional regulator [Pseudodonghicola sp.]|nr:MarR family transcriptional regulator [Pseudodonghicola sp.]
MGDETKNGQPYHLDSQVGFTMRQANQRHLSIFARHIPELTPTQFATIAKLCELGQASQNALGRATAMDAATIKGVVDRLRRRDLVASAPDPNDQRRVFLTPTDAGRALYASVIAAAHAVTSETLSPLEPEEREVFLRLLRKMI